MGGTKVYRKLGRSRQYIELCENVFETPDKDWLGKGIEEGSQVPSLDYDVIC